MFKQKWVESIPFYSNFSGNPKRFQSKDVVRMEPGMRSGSRPIDGPVEEIETAGQRHLQGLLQHQLDTQVTISGYGYVWVIIIYKICNAE